MCLIIVTRTPSAFTREHLEDFYQHNQDGVGVMYRPRADNHAALVVEKLLFGHDTTETQAVDQLVEFWTRHAALAEAEGVEFAAHFRMRTHGDIDELNCHPYHVAGDVWLMHNGVLSHGNHADKSKSDTWHYARKLAALAERHGREILANPSLHEIIEGDIGANNRFVLVGPDWDSMAVLNRRTGVEFNGAWLSNTYAWSAGWWMGRQGASASKGRRTRKDYDWAEGAGLAESVAWDWVSNPPTEKLRLGWDGEDGDEQSEDSLDILIDEYLDDPSLVLEDLESIPLHWTTDPFDDALALDLARSKDFYSLQELEYFAEKVLEAGGPFRWATAN